MEKILIYFLQAFASPFQFPVTAETFNFVSSKSICVKGGNVDTIWIVTGNHGCCAYFWHSKLLLNSRGEMAPAENNYAGI